MDGVLVDWVLKSVELAVWPMEIALSRVAPLANVFRVGIVVA